MTNSHIVIFNWKDRTHPEAGGAEEYCENLAADLTDAGSRVTIVTRRARTALAKQSVDGYAIRRLGNTYTCYPFALLWLYKNRKDIDGIIDSQNGIPFFSPLAARRRTPIALLIHHVHQEQFSTYFPKPVAAIGRWLEKSGSRYVYGDRPICAVSPSSRSEIRNLLSFKGPVHVMPNGHRKKELSKVERASRVTITCVGRLVPHKRWELLLHAVPQLLESIHDLDLHLIGSGSDLERLQELVATLKIERNVTLHGRVSNEMRDQLLGQAWLTLSTSVGEGWGLAIIEAAAQGIPAVAFDVPGLRDSIKPGVTGWLAREGELIDTILSAILALRDPIFARDTQAACRLWAESRRWEATSDRFRAVLASEAARLRRPGEQRIARSDAAALITLDQFSAKQFKVETLRLTDQTTFCPDCVNRSSGLYRIMLGAADEWDAYTVLARSQLSPYSTGVSIDLCRSADLLQWHGNAMVHTATALQTHVCPHEARVSDDVHEKRREST